jgi:hypothetical protein
MFPEGMKHFEIFFFSIYLAFSKRPYRVWTRFKHIFKYFLEFRQNLNQNFANQVVSVVQVRREVTKIGRYIIKSGHEAIAGHLLRLPCVIL